ncbi:MAG: N-acetylmuramoyl-L-alanine amidase [Firmicutes bacterium]|nr:N-acetylmuramoyl-L-alanine amidase [Bacillota bacterium]
MKKIAVTIMVLFCLLFNTAAQAAMVLEYDGKVQNYSGTIYSLCVNGVQLDDLPLEPIIFNDRAVVPVREVFETLGAKVDYDLGKISVKLGNTTVELQIDSPKAKVNGVTKNIPDNVSPKLIAKKGDSAKTMVPARFISESVGLNVDFDEKNAMISIYDNNHSAGAVNSGVKLSKIAYSQNGNTVTVRVSANKEIDRISSANVTSSNVLYVDVPNAKYTASNKTEVNAGAVKSVRLGHNSGYTRIAIDTENMQKYSVSLSDDKKSVVFSISTGDSLSTPVPTPSATAKPTAKPNNGKKIVVLDAGHGGSDPGCHTEKGGKTINEKTIALSVTQKVKTNLEANGISVIMTRDGDTYPELTERADIANNNGACIFMSIHVNSTSDAETKASGIEVYYSTMNNGDDYGVTSKEMAEEVLKDIVSFTSAKSRGVKTANHVVTRTCTMPANLIEIGFINNPEDLKNITDSAYQDKLAAGIAYAIIDIYSKIQLP